MDREADMQWDILLDGESASQQDNRVNFGEILTHLLCVLGFLRPRLFGSPECSFKESVVLV